MRATCYLLFAALCGAPIASAHHGWSEYDASKPLTLSGRVLDTGYEHPHGSIRLEAPGKTWHVVLAPPSRLKARGLAPSDLKPGTNVSVVGYASRSKPDELRAERISVEGKTVELR
jgi:hypothetical protein